VSSSNLQEPLQVQPEFEQHALFVE
jgi:hypothetical protein